MESDRDPLRKIPTKHAPEAKADIGSVLKAARTKKGATLEAVGQHTRIPKKFLDALENNRYEEFPALAYLRGFLKSYCDYLEVDFEPLWKQVIPDAPPPTQQSPVRGAAAPAPRPSAPAPKPTHTDDEPTPTPPPQAAKPQPAAPPPPAVAAAPKPAAEPPHAPAPKAHAPAPKAAKAQPPKPPARAEAHPHPVAPTPDEHAAPSAPSPAGAAGAIAAAVAVAALIGVWLFMPRQQKTATPPPPPQPPAALQPLSKPASEPALTVLFRRDMWVSISIDGVEKFQGRVPQGSKQEWKAKKTIALRASDPQALKLTLNGSPYTLPAPEADGTFRIEAP